MPSSLAYLLVFQAFVGFFCSHIARTKRRNPVLWWTVGAFVPVVGLLVCLGVRPASRRPTRQATPQRRRRNAQRPAACTGSYIPECWGCPHFRRPLFDGDHAEGKVGHCAFYDRDLLRKERPRAPRMHAGDDRS
jgi:hypothetical protein